MIWVLVVVNWSGGDKSNAHTVGWWACFMNPVLQRELRGSGNSGTLGIRPCICLSVLCSKNKV